MTDSNPKNDRHQTLVDDGAGPRRSTVPNCPTCGTKLEAISYDERVLRCPKCTSRAAPPPYVAVLVTRSDDSILCTWNAEFGGWVLPGVRLQGEETTEHAVDRYCAGDRLGAMKRTLAYESTTERGAYFFVYLVEVADVDRLGKDGQLAWLTRADILRRSPLAAFYRNMFAVVGFTSAHGPSYEAALDAAGRWLKERQLCPDVTTVASLIGLLQRFAIEHAALIEETYRVDTIVRLERIGTLQRQCHQLEQSMLHAAEPVAALAKRIDAVEYDRGCANERLAILRLIEKTAAQYQTDDWTQIADACRRLASRILDGAHRC
jgi:hypothetical protein